MLRRFWFEFDPEGVDDFPPGVRVGCGVTAQNVELATALVHERVFGGRDLPRIRRIVPDIDIRLLDEGHVRPNMGNPVVAGIWFPLGY